MFQEKLYTLRKQKGLSQEQLAAQLGVSRQAVQKWESGTANPDMNNLVALSECLGVCVDYLLKDNVEQNPYAAPTGAQNIVIDDEAVSRGVERAMHKMRYEYKSEREWHGLPLVHVCFGVGPCKAKGVIAVGNTAIGIVSVGIFSVGVISIGVMSVGLLALAAISVGILSLGAIATGVFAFGGVAVGYLAMGGLAIGGYAAGGSAMGSAIAIGGRAQGTVAIGNTAIGEHTLEHSDFLNRITASDVKAFFEQFCPTAPEWIRSLFVSLFH